MENKKNLKISAAVCDVRSVSEETLAAYGQVAVSCATLISSQQARALLGRYGVRVTAANTIDAEGDVRLTTANGVMKLTPSQTSLPGKALLMVNGKLDIAPGCEEVLKGYAAIIVNGAVNIPESMTALLGGISINGAVSTYPDGCIRLSSTTVLDRTFPLRARQDALYHAASRIVAVNGDISFQKLAEKNVRFDTQKLLIAESLVEAALPLFSEQADIQILPDGCAYVDDDAELTESLVRRHGGKLYVDGDLVLLEDGPWLDQVTYLRVDGSVLAAQDLAERLNAMDAAYDGLYFVGGTLLMDKPSVRLTRAMLENAQHGLSLASCANVTVDEDVSVQLLQEKLVSIITCANVVCSEEQCAVIEPLAENTAVIGPGKKAEGTHGDPSTVKISAAFYTL